MKRALAIVALLFGIGCASAFGADDGGMPLKVHCWNSYTGVTIYDARNAASFAYDNGVAIITFRSGMTEFVSGATCVATRMFLDQ